MRDLFPHDMGGWSDARVRDHWRRICDEWSRIKREPSGIGTTGPRLTPLLIELLDEGGRDD